MNPSKAITDDLTFLIGAGASADAEIPISSEMIKRLEHDLGAEVDNQFLLEIYNYVYGAMLFAKGCQNNSYKRTINIEDIMKTLRLLENRQSEEIYPFVGGWHEKVSQFETESRKCFSNLIKFIEDKLIDWVDLKDFEIKANYLQGFAKLASDLGLKLRLFTLNYDLTIETALQNAADCSLQCGFDNEDIWNADSYDETEADIYLYKLHGSVDWFNQDGKIIRSKNQIGERLLIFGVDNKLQSIDPFLYQTYQFREHAFRSNLITVVGYSFSDSYINRIVFQALQTDASKKLLIINRNGSKLKDELSKVCLNEMKYKLPINKVHVLEITTEKLFKENLLKPKIVEIYQEIENELPF